MKESVLATGGGCDGRTAECGGSNGKHDDTGNDKNTQVSLESEGGWDRQ